MPAIVAVVPAPERQFDFWVGEWDVVDPTGRVRQFWQQSADRGATWTVAFDGLYVRREAGDEPRT